VGGKSNPLMDGEREKERERERVCADENSSSKNKMSKYTKKEKKNPLTVRELLV